MQEWTMGVPMMIFGFVFMVLVLGAVTAGAVWLVQTLTHSRGRPRRTAMDELDERYARGEIDRDDYLQRREDLGRV